MCERGCVWRGGGYECGSGVSSECGSGVRVWREQDMDVGVDVGVVWAWRCVDMGVWRGGGVSAGGESLDVSVCGVELSVACRVVK